MNRYTKMTDLYHLCAPLEELLMTGTAYGRSGRQIKAMGLSTLNNLFVLGNLIQELKPTSTLETGMAFGASTLAILAALRAAGVPKYEHVAIDPFQRTDFDDCAVLGVERANLHAQLETHYQPSHFVLPRLLESKRCFGLIYIDGSHLFEDVFLDAFYCAKLLKLGGVMLFDDSADAQVAKVLRFIRRNLGDALIPMELGDFRADRGHTWKYRLAKRLGRNQLSAFTKRADTTRHWSSKLVGF
jgi:predicted O-methyltransferase YrrM